MSKPRLFAYCSLLFFFSGMTGLIYESMWAQYLKLLLGHAAYAQLLVLVIFMGGMALGAAICAGYSYKIKHLLKAYAITEACLGLYGIFFHTIFTTAQFLLEENIVSTMQSPSMARTVLWVAGALLMIPQSILLGATFPLMTSAILRVMPEKASPSIAWLYFVNTIGGALGVLLSGFILMDYFGLPGTMIIAGVINGLIALTVWYVAIPTQPIKKTTIENNYFLYASLMILIYALLTGLASFLYQIAWIRMLSMVLGSSTHAFELMLSAFIAGLAMGSLYVYKIMNTLKFPLKSLAIIQILMGMMALSTIPLYNISFDIFYYLSRLIPKTNSGHHLFYVLSHGFCFLFMLPTTFFAGMTLPILTKLLLDKGYGEKSVGQVYAANTLGAIMGAILAQQWLMPQFGLKTVVGFGAFIDMALGIFILFSLIAHRKKMVCFIICFFTALYAFGILRFVPFNKNKMASGIFEFVYSPSGQQESVLFHKDGKTATVSVLKSPEWMMITTNGKADASMAINRSVPLPDEKTQTMLAIIPWAYVPEAKKVAVIGLGSGMTTHSLLSIPSLAQVDTLEIEPAMVEGAKWFGETVEKAFYDKRSRIFIEDARAFFVRTKNKYDIIISEPSNPWVSGVSSLFTEEFYKKIKKNIALHGVFAQWIQLYDISPYLVATIFNTLGKHFKNYVVYYTSDVDLLVIASDDNLLEESSEAIFSNIDTRKILERFSVHNTHDLLLHRLSNKNALEGFLKTLNVETNSDYFPILDLNIEKSRFLADNFFSFITLKNEAFTKP